MSVDRPRVRAADGSGELRVPPYELFTSTEVMGQMAMERMLAGLSTRGYGVGAWSRWARAVSAAAHGPRPSRRSRPSSFLMTQTALAELLAADLSELDLVALMVYGVQLGAHCCIVALGIGIDGVKHPLALVEGSTQNPTPVTKL